MAPRQADGSLPNVNFLRLTAGSDLIDKGTNVGLPFAGTAPDLGAFEFGAPLGGASGTGGAAGTGGARPTETGGDSGTGGHVSTGGTANPGSGGDGMVIATGGTNGTGGATSPGAGGAVTQGEMGGAGGTTLTGGAHLIVSTGSGSCSCVTSRESTSASPLLWLFVVALISARRKR